MTSLTLNPRITTAGLQSMQNADATGVSLALTHIAVGTALYTLGNAGDADDTAARAMTALKAEVARYPISSGTNPTKTSVQIGVTITDTDPNGKSPNGKSIGEIGFYAGNTLWAVWSQAATALFVKSAGFDIPFAYTFDTSAFPLDQVTVQVSADPQAMATMINQHEAKADPHPQYATDTDVANLTAVVGTKQPNLGFTPAQQGGGTGQGANKINVGAASDGSGNVKIAVDGTDKGNIAFLNSPAFTGAPTAPTGTLGDASKQIANNAFVAATLSNALVGQIVFEPRASARANYLKLNGALVNRADYPALWAYAQASGAITDETTWAATSWGCFSTGDGATTFRLPELRGEFIRCFDDGRGADSGRAVGTYQATQNATHTHTAVAAAVGDHTHSAYTDSQGYHGHGVSDPGHSHSVNGVNLNVSVNDKNMTVLQPSSYGTNVQPSTNGSGTGIGINGDGTHGHNVGVNAAGGHTHTLTVAAQGGTEARPRNVALTPFIRAL